LLTGRFTHLEELALSAGRPLGWIVVSSILAAPGASAGAADGGGLVGWVESTRGAPIAGAVVSIFGKGIRGGSLITLSDSQGQFVLPSLPAGSYTLRAVGAGHEPSAAEHVTVLPNRDSLFTLSLAPAGSEPDAERASAREAQSQSLREWLWLLRHKRRSVLEAEGQERGAFEATDEGLGTLTRNTPTATSAPGLGPLDGSVELVATSGASAQTDSSSLGVPGGLGALRLSGRLTDGVDWSLGGLVAENEGRAWRLAAEFVIDPGGAHEIEAGAGYAAADTRSLLSDEQIQPDRAVGAVFARDRWRVGERLTATAGGRYTYIGFLPDPHHADAVVQIDVQGSPGTVIRGSISTRTLIPGGDWLTLSTVAASPAITWARLEDGLRPSRTRRGDVGVDHAIGPARLGAYLFRESTSDALLTTFEGSTPSFRNAGGADAGGFGVSLGRRFGSSVDGSITYTYGRARTGYAALATDPRDPTDRADFHDVAARLEAMIDLTDTRLTAFYRFNTLTDARRVPRASGQTARASSRATRFDVQLTQGLDFLAPLTRADWELLLAVRNMFYEASQGGLLDELAVQGPPTRVVGGVSVRF
jgi:hypothetical protein